MHMKNFLTNIGRGLLGLTYLALPIIGWNALRKSFKRVQSGEVSIVKNINGTFEILNQGFYFRPFPGDHFGKNYPVSEDYIDLGPVKRVRIKEGEQGVINCHGNYKIINAGVHYIDATRGEIFDFKKDVQKINSLDYQLGAQRYITILNGELGESYRKGQFVLLEPGKHILPPEHIFVKKVSVANDIVDLGALKIVTVKQGQVAIINGPDGNIIKLPGKHYINQEDGFFFDKLLTVSPQVLKLEPLVVMCADKIDMKAEAVLLYEIKEPLKTVGSGVARVVVDLKEYAEGTLRSILRRFSSSDIAQTLHQDENHSSHEREKKLGEIHNDFVGQLDARASGWGIKINDLQFTHILPADENYHATIRDLGVRQSTADANKTLAESEATVANIRATAEQAKVIAAEIEQKEAVVKANTELQTKKILAEAEYQQTMQKARAQADGIKLVAEAEVKRFTQLGQAADGLKSEVACQLALLNKQNDILQNVKNPVFIQPQLGQTSVWSRDQNRTTFFTTKQKKEGATDVTEYLALEASKRSMELGK